MATEEEKTTSADETPSDVEKPKDAASEAADGAEAAGGDDDIMEEPEGDGLLVALSREAGVVARHVSNGLRGFSRRIGTGPARTVRRPKTDIPALMEELGKLMTSADGDYAELAKDDTFWQLITRLGVVASARRRRARARRVRKLPETRKRTGKIIDAEAEETTESPKKKKKSAGKAGGAEASSDKESAAPSDASAEEAAADSAGGDKDGE